MMIAACEEHIELALDVAVDEWEAAPIVETAKEVVTCQFCEQQAIYTVTK
ncbi:CxxH/CxxC protein [Shouchella sp. 1P09AA]